MAFHRDVSTAAIFAAVLAALLCGVLLADAVSLPELAPRSNSNWLLAPTCCQGCSYPSGCCCGVRHPVTKSIRPAPATKTVTITAKKNAARAYYAVDYVEQKLEELEEEEVEEETLMEVRAAASVAQPRHVCAVCPAGVVPSSGKNNNGGSSKYCCPPPKTVTKTLARKTITVTKTAVPPPVVGRLYLDNNGNGRYDVGIDAPIANMIVDLVRPLPVQKARAAGGTVIAVGNTDANGVLNFPPVTMHPGETLWITIHDVITRIIAVITVGQQGSATANMPVNPPGTPCTDGPTTTKTSTVTSTSTTVSISVTTSTVTVQGGACMTTSHTQTKSATKSASKSASKTNSQQAGTTAPAAGTTTKAASTTKAGTTTVGITTTRNTPLTGTPVIVYSDNVEVTGPTVYDDLGNAFVSGTFTDWAQMGGTNVTVDPAGQGKPAIFINKINPVNNVSWTYYGYCSGGYEQINMNAIDAAGDGSTLLEVSAMADWLMLPPHNISVTPVNASNPDARGSINALVKLNPDGSVAWVLPFGNLYNSYGPEGVKAVAAPKGNNAHAYVSGRTSNAKISFGPGVNASTVDLGFDYGFLAQVDWATGVANWVKVITQDDTTFSGADRCRSRISSLVTTSTDNVYAAGLFYCNSTFMGTALPQPRPFKDQEWSFTMLVQSSGNAVTWAKTWGDNNPYAYTSGSSASSSTFVNSIDLSSDETKLLMGGSLNNDTTTYSDGTPIPMLGDQFSEQGYMLRVDAATGTLEKVMSVGGLAVDKQYSPSGHSCSYARFDQAGNMYCAGTQNDMFELYNPPSGNFSTTTGNGTAVIILKFDNNGQYVSHMQIEGRNDTAHSAYIKGMAVNYLGQVILTLLCYTNGDPLLINGANQTYPNGAEVWPPTTSAWYQTVIYDSI